MIQNLTHIIRGAALLGGAAAVSDIIGNVQILGLNATNAAIITSVLVAIQSWLNKEAANK